jgi:hypothetical protein
LSSGPQLSSGGGSTQFDGSGRVSVVSGQGHNSSNDGGAAFKETPTGTWTVGPNGSGTLTLPYPSDVTSATALFGSAPRTPAVSADVNVGSATVISADHPVVLTQRDHESAVPIDIYRPARQ